MNYEKNILDAIEILLNKRLSTLSYNYYIDAKVLQDNLDGTYDVQINSETYTLKAREGVTLVANDLVLICVRNGNFSDKHIDMKRPWKDGDINEFDYPIA